MHTTHNQLGKRSQKIWNMRKKKQTLTIFIDLNREIKTKKPSILEAEKKEQIENILRSNHNKRLLKLRHKMHIKKRFSFIFLRHCFIVGKENVP